MSDQPKQPYFSPLRYPGGKAALYGFLKNVLEANKIQNGVYAEAFAGGAGAALALLLNKKVSRIILNDKDPFVYKFWWSVLNNPAELIELIQNTEVTLKEYYIRKRIFRSPHIQSTLADVELGFTAFFLNRCNRSGILHAGPIGGAEQKSKWKINARYNKDELVFRIKTIYELRDKITIYNLDAREFLQKLKRLRTVDLSQLLVYLDPPYYVQGFQLYKHFFNDLDHSLLAKYMKKQADYRWIMSYDDDSEIVKLYHDCNQNHLWFNYFANTQKTERELIISNELCQLPAVYQQYSRQQTLNQLSIAFAEIPVATV